MELILVMTVMLGLISFPQHSALPPGSEAAFVSSELEEVECREEAMPTSSLGEVKPTRATHFRLFGQYECHRPIFSANERDPYVETVLKAEGNKAKQVSLKVLMGVQALSAPTGPIGIEIVGVEDVQLRNTLEALYRSELLAVLGPGRVRTSLGAAMVPRLVIRVRRVDSPELISKASIVMEDSGGEVTWREL